MEADQKIIRNGTPACRLGRLKRKICPSPAHIVLSIKRDELFFFSEVKDNFSLPAQQAGKLFVVYLPESLDEGRS
ncbi:MAG: hypothetical protein WCE54_23640 [Ignavibacteriaceae bacterium]